MLRTIFRRYPLQLFLLGYNTGVFIWLKVTGLAIRSKLGLALGNPPIPDWLESLTQGNLSNLQGFFTQLPWFWLGLSMIALVIWQLIKGILKIVIFIAILLLGIYLIYRHQSLLSQLPG